MQIQEMRARAPLTIVRVGYSLVQVRSVRAELVCPASLQVRARYERGWLA
jgi:hypothetical protein